MKRGTNSTLMKEHNKKLILNLIRQERLSRANIATQIGLTRASVTILMEELMREGFVAEEESDYAGVGRRPVYLTLRKDAGYAIGVNISRHAYRLGLANLAGELLETRECRKMERQSYEIVREIAAQVRYLADEARGGRVIGVGVSTPGPVDYKTNTILNPPSFPGWHDCEIGRRLSELCGRFAVHIGIITAPAQFAQDICDAMVLGGIKAIWNFAPVHLNIPGDVIITNENLAASLAALSSRLRQRQEEQRDICE